MWRTSRGVDDWTDTTYEEIKTLTNQKTLQDNLLDSKPPETSAMTLDPHSAAKAFSDMLNILGKMRGIAVGGPVGPLTPIFFLKILLSWTFANSGGVMVRRHFPNLALPMFDFAPPSTPLQSSPIRQSSWEDIRPLATWVGKLSQC
jgi:hypothetical protein